MKSAQLVYTIISDDVRLEMGNKLSLMGIFENLFLTSFPAVILRIAIVNHWVGNGDFQTQVRLLSPDGTNVAVSSASSFRIEPEGYADNVTFFANVSFERAGTYRVQTLLEGAVVSEKPLYVRVVQQPPSTVN